MNELFKGRSYDLDRVMRKINANPIDDTSIKFVHTLEKYMRAKELHNGMLVMLHRRSLENQAQLIIYSKPTKNKAYALIEKFYRTHPEIEREYK